MSTEKSLKNSFTYVGVLIIIEGLSLLLCPHLTTKLLLLLPLQTAQAEQYARAAGLGLAVIGYYYIVGGKYASVGFYRASIIGRLFVFPIMAALIYFCSMEISFIAFGIQDLMTAFYSYTYLKAYDEEQVKTKK